MNADIAQSQHCCNYIHNPFSDKDTAIRGRWTYDNFYFFGFFVCMGHNVATTINRGRYNRNQSDAAVTMESCPRLFSPEVS